MIILGPTASGKTKLAVSVAAALNGEIISADSRQVFKGMDIGTGKDLDEYKINGKLIPYHLIDHKEPGMRYQVNAFKVDFYKVFESITARHKLPVLCGGTGMYIHSLLQNHEYTAIPVNETLREKLMPFELSGLQTILKEYPPHLWHHADQSTHKRLIRAIEIAEYLKHNKLETLPKINFKPLIIGLKSGVESRRTRIRERLEQRLKDGLVEEVQQLLANGVSKEMLVFYGLEYKFVVAYLSGELNYPDFKERLFTAICQFAKRQMTFFRKMEKDGIEIHWFDIDQESVIEVKTIDLYEKNAVKNQAI
ncbi:tRNA (adenosine(37)-N6)-dimethylallyltransferase MiaA [Pedobacter immunditicola]|uniref:tRNA (adenosine(37)-N6)-dimethylallyltransferase MiaA n=1 Tax=Pedobacter immunditicola TaxID=3133440 RepID=UPI0030967153